MSKQDWKYIGPEIEKSVVDEVGSNLSIEFPADYISFVTVHNGARPIANLVNLPSGREVVMKRLLPIDLDSEYGVLNTTKLLIHIIGQNIIPFGEDHFGNLFCFKFEGTKCAKIVFWDHEKETTIQICKSFSEFLDLLHSREIE